MAGLTLANVGAQLKVQYANDWINVVPQNSIHQQFRDPKAPGMTGNKEELGKDVAVPIKWILGTRSENGKYWVLPAKTQSGQGLTYTGVNGGLSTLESALEMKFVEANVYGAAATIRQQVPYTVAATADGSVNKSFEGIAKLVMDDMRDVVYQRYEISSLWGQSGIGVIESQTYSNPTLTVIISAKTFCPTLWVSSIGARVQFFNPTTGNISQGANTSGYATIAGVNTVTHTITFTVDSDSGWVNTTVPAALDNIFFKTSKITGGTSATYSNEMAGLYLQFTATTGTLFNIDRSTTPLFQGQEITAGGQSLTQAFIVQCAMKLADKGCFDDLVIEVGTASWADLNTENMTLRLFDSSYSPKKSTNGSEYITYSNLNGQIRVVCHPLMKAGYALMFNPGQTYWVGACDVTFNTPGVPDQQLFVQIADSDGYEVRNYCNKAIYHSAPSMALAINNIVPQS